jgi:hypothetical protein
MIIWLRCRVTRSDAPSEVAFPVAESQHLTNCPQEDEAASAAWVNWWLSDQQRQAIAHHEAPTQPQNPDEVPDMFDEGRKRLDEEERNRFNNGN